MNNSFLINRHNSWLNYQNLLFIDAPTGTGFSDGKPEGNYEL
jgi:carboxypeptidase C (cathepsin A)